MFDIIKAEIKENSEYRFGSRGTFWGRFALSRWSWTIALDKFSGDWSPKDRDVGTYYCLHLFCLWITLWRGKPDPDMEMMKSWGIDYDHGAAYLCFRFGNWYSYWHMIWAWDYCETEIMLIDRTFVKYDMFTKGSFEIQPEPANTYREVFDYQYKLKSGEVQQVKASIKVDRRTWYWRNLLSRWLKWPSKSRTSIDVKFDSEVGEQTGSWKGGCVGCGLDLLPGESPEQCLRRMEATRKF